MHSQAYSDCDVIDNDVIMLKLVSICGKIQKIYMQNECISCNKCCITIKIGTKVAHDKLISLGKENFELSTDVRDNDVIMLKFELFRRKALNFERLYLGTLWMKLCKTW